MKLNWYRPPCECPICAADPLLLTGVGEHTYRLDARNGVDVPQEWRWMCGCGSKGRWQSQTPYAAYHAWRVHARLEQ